jgi:hypothetical protein
VGSRDGSKYRPFTVPLAGGTFNYLS